MQEPQHSFGGSRFDRHVMDFETVLEGEAGLAAAPAPAAPAPAAAEPAGWAGPSQQEWEASQSFQRQLLEAINEPDEPVVTPAAAQPVEPETPEQIAQRLYEERMGPYAPLLDQIAEEKGREIVTAHIDKLKTDDEEIKALGAFDTTKAVLMSQAFLAQGMSAEQAIRQAALEIGGITKSAREGALTAENQQITNRLETPASPPTSPAALTETPARPRGEDRYTGTAERWLEARRGSTNPTG